MAQFDDVSAGFSALATGDYAKAAACGRAALAQDRRDPAALTLMGRLALISQRPDVARALFLEALATDARPASVWLDLAQALTDLREDEAALDAAKRAVDAEPQHVPAHIRLGEMLFSLNRRSEAEAVFQAALAIDSKSAKALVGLARASSPDADNPLIAHMAALAIDATLARRDRALLLYALAPAYRASDAKAYIAHVLAANLAQGRPTAADVEAYEKSSARLERAYTSEAFSVAKSAQPREPRPLFILGMPRSGTTLTEQLLAAHPDVVPGGELNFMRGPLTASIERATGQPFPAGFETLSAEQMEEIAATYSRRITLIAHGAPNVTDKTPGNYHLLGLLLLLFPQARIIHTRRDPMDTCFSILQYPFDDRSPHTYDMTLLGLQYRHYMRLMARWDELFPGRFLTMDYEDLVAHPEQEGARLFKFCGLTWDARYLRFHENGRAVRTFSAEQVRQPIYSTSIGSWRQFSAELEPLRQALYGS